MPAYTYFYVWLFLAAGLGIVWLFRFLAVGVVLKNRAVLGSSSYDAPPERAPSLSVILAAKDEEDNIETCITSLLEQDYPDFEIIVVDDRSTDATPTILRRLESRFGGEGGRLRVLTVKTLRDGWFGKNNAMREGVAASSGEWLLFTDADCHYTSRNTLSVAMRESLAQGSDFLSITPVLDAPSVWERIIQPVCALVLILWFVPEKVNDPEKKAAYANGAFMLMRKSCYDAIGGHDRVRTEINEDICMAQIAKRMSLRLRVTENDDLYHTRMYDTPIAAWHGWSRIFYGSLATIRRLIIAVAMLAVLSVMPWASLAAAMIGYAQAGGAGTSLWAWSVWAWLAVVVIEQMFMWRVYRVLSVRPVWSLTHPLGALVALTMVVNAMFKVVGATGTTWRGTTYRGDQLENQTEHQVKPSLEAGAAPEALERSGR